MTNKTPSHDPAPSQDTVPVSTRTTILSEDVGITLTISSEALEELDRIQEETIKAAQEVQKFSCR